MLSEITTTRDGLKANSSVAGDTEFTGIGEFVAELKEMAQVQYQKQLGHVSHWKCYLVPVDAAHSTCLRTAHGYGASHF